MTRRAAAALAVAAGLALFLPWDRIDPAVSRLFYRPEIPLGPWQDPRPVPWGMVAHLTPVIAIGLAVTGLAFLVRALFPGRTAAAGAHRHDQRQARPAIVLLLVLTLGPGLLVNVILKDHWHRPRPRQTLGFGGDFAYVAPFRIGPVGKSFPCGHSAVGFACIALAGFVDARRRGARLAVVAGALVLGSLLGLGRVATGAHFASDVVWSALLTFAILLVVDRAVARRPVGARGRIAAAAVVAAAGLASTLLCFPFRHEAAAHALPLPDPGGALDLRIDVGHARLIFVPPGEPALTVESRHNGFGVPWGRIDETMAPGSVARYRLASRGWFADLEGTTILRVPAGTVGRVEIDVADGHLTLNDESGGAALPAIRCRIRQDALRLRGNLRRDQIELVER